MTELDDNIDTLVTGVGKLADQLADFKTDFDAAIAKLQSGNDNAGAITKLKALSTQLGTMSDALTALDTTAEGISGTPTPPPAG